MPAMRFKSVLFCLLLSSLAGCDTETVSPPDPLEQTNVSTLPSMRWGHMEGHSDWNLAADAALQTHGQVLTQVVPRDIGAWCPAYPEADPAQRRLFWVGFLSALAKHESTYRPWAVGGGDQWYGLVQISPSTARGYGCRAKSGVALKYGTENVSCAIRIMAVTVPRDGVIAAKDSRWRGVAADWAPLQVASKRADMSAWLRAQPFCAAPAATPVPAQRRPLSHQVKSGDAPS